jgi:hypothetical protein
MSKPTANRQNVVSSATYNPEWEKQALENMNPRDRHQKMLAEHREDKSRARDQHRRGTRYRKMPATHLI